MNFKKTVSLALAILMLMSALSVASVSAAGSAAATTFKFTDNQNWGSVYVYCWDANGKGIGEEWPGVAGRDAEVNGYGETFFTIDVPAGAVGCVVNDGKGNQTSDITDFTAEGYYTDGTKDAKGHFIAIPWPGNDPTDPTATSAKEDSWYLWGSFVDSEEVSTDFGDKDEWNKPTAYGFKNGKLTTTFEHDAYVGVKNLSNNHWYMTDGYAGEVQTATLYNTDTYTFTGTDPLTAKDKLHIPAGVQVTITMAYNSADDTVTLSYTTGGSVEPTEGKTDGWYLWGSLVASPTESTDFGDKTEWDKPTPYGFKNGKLTTTFELDAYVGVKNLSNNHWYMTDGYAGEVQSATLYNTDTYTFTGTDPLTAKDKLHIPAGVEVTISMVYNTSDDTVTLSYETTQEPTTEKIEETTTVPETTPETEPTTVAPTEATTAAPTTEPVTETAEPTTVAPTTAEPTTAAPTTAEPTTVAPTTAEPTTVAPTTAEPTTEAPTQAPTTQPATEKQKVDISNWEVVGLTNSVYTGKAITKKIVVTDGSSVAKFTTIYTNNKNAGVATIVIQGTGDYTGTIVKTFNIAKASQKMTVKAKTKSVKAKALKKAKKTINNVFTVKNKKGTVTYTKKSGSKFVTINNKGVITVKKGKYKAGKKFTIQVKVTAKGDKNYKAKSKTVKVTIKVK